jgi:S1-C subfamily serine protease
MNSWVFGRGDGRAIAMDVAERVVQSLRSDGRIKRAYLGVGTQQVQLQDAVRSKAGQESGLLVITVDPKSPADQAGIMQGDTLVALGGASAATLEDLYRKVRTLKVGAKETVKVIRAGEVKELSLTVGEASREQN